MSKTVPSVLVTGGSGFLGSEVIKKLVETEQYKVTSLDNLPPSLGSETFSNVRYIRANVLQPSELEDAFEQAKPVIVIHTAGVYDLGNKRYQNRSTGPVYEVNIQGTKNVLEAAKRNGAKGLVYTSSFSVLVDEIEADFHNADETWPTGRATLPYGRAKTAAENLVLASNTSSFRTCSLRPTLIFGPNDPTVIPRLHDCIARGETSFVIGDGSNLNDFVYVSNVADAHVLAASNLLESGTAAGQAFFITNGEPVSARDFCVAVWKEFGHVPSLNISVPPGLAWWLGWTAEWVSCISRQPSTLSMGVVRDAAAVRYMSIEKARRVLGYVPRVSLPEAVVVSCQDYKEKLQSQRVKKNKSWD
ncbi:C-3 sterol dehydrogenase/C-4 decarboxylase-like protein [Westerdykella ornata]|uniref:C-3 sterol dehydrogenase/C-4 decarboxylase-like protein n=1 Tax=Westerdykella ornata TaxID=318751 RepID=A0A6A6JX93_WESOR|nr:C-3 sterol dehydrogenase/C-4 decarboxylase-like protein [Westerdykella ornata]KAF2280814.1 C-3 sterol dehydrogenase/C-4 decarboxylase-like protein [Westerdykella ornata]